MTLRELCARHGLDAFVPALEREHVTLDDLGQLTDDDLRDTFGMVAFLDRKRFRGMVAEVHAADPGGTPSDGATRLGTLDPRDGATRTGAPLVDHGATRMDGPGPLPTQLGSYRILGRVGAGGMGTVLRARHLEEGWAAQQGGDVAIKLIHPQIAASSEFRARFLAEAALGRKIQHPGLVPTWDVIVDGSWLGTVMAFVAGQTLSSFVRPGGLPVEEVLRLVGPLGETLDYLHAQGIVHRDVKPANVVVRTDGRPILLDLGIAKDAAAGELHTRTMTAMGTSAWMAPEQADAKHVDGAADRYAFGLMVYALLSGRMPWDEGTSEFRVVSMKLTNQLTPLASLRSDLPAPVAAAVMRMLSVAPGDRYASCAAFVWAVTPGADARAATCGTTAPPSQGDADAARRLAPLVETTSVPSTRAQGNPVASVHVKFGGMWMLGDMAIYMRQSTSTNDVRVGSLKQGIDYTLRLPVGRHEISLCYDVLWGERSQTFQFEITSPGNYVLHVEYSRWSSNFDKKFRLCVEDGHAR